MEQLHYRNTFEPQDAEQLTYDEKMKALESLIFLKEKSTIYNFLGQCGKNRIKDYHDGP